jgi:hypothetical protein
MRTLLLFLWVLLRLLLLSCTDWLLVWQGWLLLEGLHLNNLLPIIAVAWCHFLCLDQLQRCFPLSPDYGLCLPAQLLPVKVAAAAILTKQVPSVQCQKQDMPLAAWGRPVAGVLQQTAR